MKQNWEPRSNPSIYGQVILTRVPKRYNEKNSVLLMMLENLNIYKRIRLDPLSPTQNQFQWIKEINIRQTLTNT